MQVENLSTHFYLSRTKIQVNSNIVKKVWYGHLYHNFSPVGLSVSVRSIAATKLPSRISNCSLIMKKCTIHINIITQPFAVLTDVLRPNEWCDETGETGLCSICTRWNRVKLCDSDHSEHAFLGYHFMCISCGDGRMQLRMHITDRQRSSLLASLSWCGGDEQKTKLFVPRIYS